MTDLPPPSWGASRFERTNLVFLSLFLCHCAPLLPIASWASGFSRRPTRSPQATSIEEKW